MAETAPTNSIKETIITERRKHWINIAPILFGSLILVLLLPAASYFYGRHSATINQFVPGVMMASLTLVYLVAVVFITGMSIWIFRQNRLVLTDHHIVEYTQRGIFNHTVSQFSLIKLQDVSASQQGLVANMFGYGTISIQTAGEAENFVFTQVPDPQDLANQIMQAHEALENSVSAETRSV